ncbi:MAG: HAMP domain-containing sensor histidine kinase [Bacteroidales bacterium]|nr:HAMP domain-containing sensor histidine kinase [Bacteroidales bacterium]MDD3890682.1 HAMP domain-containing sensor histidine kinase [Bacteroidales bacterium]
MRVHIVKQRWKLILLFVAIAIGFASLFITNSLVKELSQEERKKIELWAQAIKELSLVTNLSDTTQSFDIIIEILHNNTTVPVILADGDDNIISHANISPRRIKKAGGIEKVLSRMQRTLDPIKVDLLDGVKNYVYYEDSTTLVRLTYYPYIQLIVIMFFILVSYYAFNYSRRAEQNSVWVGMAKETAHQLGTPTSSLLAWLEILKESNLKPSLVENFEKDVARLEKIVDRFSKIGSSPVLSETNLTQIISGTIDYLRNRLSNKIEIEKKYDDGESILLPLNETLFEWVIENLIKNAVDAVNGTGKVSVSISDSTQVVFVDISDNGKGIQRSYFKSVFQPGFTTKTRGWGLGLSLSKRIIEENHGGKLFINHSELDKGTTFRIVLKKRF